MKSLLPVICLLIGSRILAQPQACPLNNNFGTGDLTHWWAYTGNNRAGNGPGAIRVTYDSSTAAPLGTLGNSTIYEYQLPTTIAIRVNTTNGTDLYGGFPIIPNINGYQYTNSILLGSTAISRSSSGGAAGGYIRGISYRINVPATPVGQPYTMTYAYAMVLENGRHNSNQQPMFTATLTTNDSVIKCASPKYLLPTLNNAGPGGGGATLDSAAAIAEGFSVSSQLSPNQDPNNNSPDAPHLQDVWTKGWREVTFDLSPYRGQQVILTFESDNCVPGGHFAYAYIALRNVCDGLVISGPLVACIGNTQIYSVPALAGATYQWTVPPGWTIVSGSDTNILKVKVAPLGPGGGTITAHEVNSCANLQDAITVTTTLPTVPGSLANNNEVCAGNNSSAITLSGYRGSILNWISSPDGVNWSPIADMTAQYTARNLTNTTIYKAVIQNGSSCLIDSSSAVTITVDPKSIGGQLAPSGIEVCTEQDKGAVLRLSGNKGSVLNWQTSTDNVSWTGLASANTDSSYNIVNLANSTEFRVIVKSGVCPADTSTVAAVKVLPALFPKATAAPADTTICYGTTASLRTLISVGTNYTWSNSGTLTGIGSGEVGPVPYAINVSAKPLSTTDYILQVFNAGCPNPLVDTFHVAVKPPVLVDAGNDTSVVIHQPLQLNATSNDPAVTFTWTPSTGLNNPNIPAPLANYGEGIDSVRYLVTAKSPIGCSGAATILVKIFTTTPDIFVPNAFTPGRSSNSVFRPIPVGIASLQFFRVFNRWGQMVYSTSAAGKGWDGYINGAIQDPGTYVWMAQGISYTGKIIFRKGTMVLIR